MKAIALHSSLEAFYSLSMKNDASCKRSEQIVQYTWLRGVHMAEYPGHMTEGCAHMARSSVSVGHTAHGSQAIPQRSVGQAAVRGSPTIPQRATGLSSPVHPSSLKSPSSEVAINEKRTGVAQCVQMTWLSVVNTWQSAQYTWQRNEGQHSEQLTVRHRVNRFCVGGARPVLGDTKKRGHAPCPAVAPRLPPLRREGCSALHALRFIARKVR